MKRRWIKRIVIVASLMMFGLAGCGNADEEVALSNQNESVEASGEASGNEQTDATSKDAQSTEKETQTNTDAAEEEEWVCTGIHTEHMMEEDQILGRVDNIDEQEFRYNEQGSRVQSFALQYYQGEESSFYVHDNTYTYDEHDSVLTHDDHYREYLNEQGACRMIYEWMENDTYEYTYDNLGQVSTQTRYHDGEFEEKNEYFYRPDGTKEKRIKTNENGDTTTYLFSEKEILLDSSGDYTYDADGNITRIEKPSTDDAVEITENTYADGKLVEHFVYIMKDGELLSVWSRYTREYGTDGHSYVQTNYLPFDIVTGDNTYTEGIVYNKEYHNYAPLKDAVSNPDSYANTAIASSQLKAFYEQNK